MIIRAWIWGCLGVLAVAQGCGGNSTTGSTKGDGSQTESKATPTYHQDVAPILAQHCVGCHHDGGIAPFALTNYEEASTQAERTKLAVVARTMPPWGVDNSGSCNTYKEARWLSEEEIQTVSAWVDGGKLMGDAATATALPEASTDDEHFEKVLDVGESYTPGGGTDDYRCFLLDPQVSTDKLVTAFRVNPGEPRVVHHVILFALKTSTAQTTAEQLDADDPGQGYSCFGATRTGEDLFVAGWAPGRRVTHYPQGTGVRIFGSRKLVMQVHYNLSAGPLPDRSTVELRLVEVGQQTKEALVVPLADQGIILPPRQASVKTPDFVVPNIFGNATILGVFPHMHTMGRTLRVDIGRIGSNKECLVDVPRWNFNWQQFYFFEKPVALKFLETLSLSCGFDTTTRTTTTRWGEGTNDEMCLNFLYATLP